MAMISIQGTYGCDILFEPPEDAPSTYLLGSYKAFCRAKRRNFRAFQRGLDAYLIDLVKAKLAEARQVPKRALKFLLSAEGHVFIISAVYGDFNRGLAVICSGWPYKLGRVGSQDEEWVPRNAFMSHAMETFAHAGFKAEADRVRLRRVRTDSYVWANACVRGICQDVIKRG
jgi:hypothetical protein